MYNKIIGTIKFSGLSSYEYILNQIVAHMVAVIPVAYTFQKPVLEPLYMIV